MKKTFITVALVGMNMMAASIGSANEFIPEMNPITPGIERVAVSSGRNIQYNIIDHNPTIYNKQVVGGHTVEGWVKNNVVNAAVDGVITSSYQINSNLETVKTNNSKGGSQYTVIDHNPANYDKQIVAGHTVEGWVKNDVVNTAVDGVITNSYRINGDLETVMSNNGKNGSQYTVIDHNPTNISKQVIAGHAVEGWVKNDVIYTVVDGVVTKGEEAKNSKV